MFGIIQFGWWMQEMTMLYLGVAIISAFICRLGESEMWDAFVKGSEKKRSNNSSSGYWAC